MQLQKKNTLKYILLVKNPRQALKYFMPCKRIFPTFQLLPLKMIYKFFILKLKFTKNLGGSRQVLYLSLLKNLLRDGAS